jgi:hypothetical protein
MGDEFLPVREVVVGGATVQLQHQKLRTASQDCTSCPKLCVDTASCSPPLSPCMLRRKSLTLSCSDDDEEESSDCNFILDFLVLGSESISLDKRGMKDLGVTVSAEHLTFIVSNACCKCAGLQSVRRWNHLRKKKKGVPSLFLFLL